MLADPANTPATSAAKRVPEGGVMDARAVIATGTMTAKASKRWLVRTHVPPLAVTLSRTVTPNPYPSPEINPHKTPLLIFPATSPSVVTITKPANATTTPIEASWETP